MIGIKKLDYPVLYSFRRCPYAMRARMALYTSRQTYELREVSLGKKPRELIELSPKATVPVLQFRIGVVIEESLEIMFWALNQEDPLKWLEPEFGTLEGMLSLIEETDRNFKHNLDRYKYSQHYNNSDPFFHRNEGKKFLGLLDSRLTNYDYLFGGKPALADYAILPFVRQFANTDRVWFDRLSFSMLQKWLKTLLNREPFTAIMDKNPIWRPGDIPKIIVENEATSLN